MSYWLFHHSKWSVIELHSLSSPFEDSSLSPGGRRKDAVAERLKAYPWCDSYVLCGCACRDMFLCCRYVGKKSRIEAEQALHRMRDGVFLIRESDQRPGEFAIALKYVCHESVLCHTELFSICCNGLRSFCLKIVQQTISCEV